MMKHMKNLQLMEEHKETKLAVDVFSPPHTTVISQTLLITRQQESTVSQIDFSYLSTYKL